MATETKNVLLVDDEEKLLNSIAQRMKLLGFTPLKATNGLAALDIARKNPIDLAIVDLQMPDMDGLVVITKLKEIDPQLRTVLLTGHGNEKVRQATESLNTFYFEKDEMADFWRFVRKLNADGQVVVIHPASARAAGGRPSAATLRADASDGGQMGRRGTAAAPPRPVGASPEAAAKDDKQRLWIVGETPAMQALRKGIARAASLDCAVTISGEPGTGKELAARAIHADSRRARQRFLAIDCTTFNNAQLTSQLLGVTGANLSDAIRTRGGIFAAEPVGTLLLDHVDKMPAHMQEQLLDTLTMAGGQSRAGLNMRITVATEIDLGQQVQAGAFRPDLYDSLSVFALRIPPLRERKDDIHPLCRYFFDRYRQELGKPVDAIAPEVIETLIAYDFPGNVRELKHIIERAVIIADGDTITRKHLPVRFLEDQQAPRLVPADQFATLAELEQRYIVEVLAATGGNKSKTAEILGISRAALWRKLKQINARQTHA